MQESVNDTDLVASNCRCDGVQRLYYAQPELLPLLVLGYCNVFDVTDESEIVNAVGRKSVELINPG
jgi:hypothetical protein